MQRVHPFCCKGTTNLRIYQTLSGKIEKKYLHFAKFNTLVSKNIKNICKFQIFVLLLQIES